ncbi:MAG: PIG-L family deacetylase [Tannerella sp.]|jgi:LmbE family N-acetylglucosaminyl deacetylase|nr:PIG-L family deacetylase [Tannerella sp.]
MKRREALKISGATIASTVAFPLGIKGMTVADKRQKVVVVGAHPDDPETGCGGTMILYAAKGYEVVSAYLTRGEAGIRGKSHQEAANIRTKEAELACKIMNARSAFIGQIDGGCEITPVRYTEMYDFLNKEAPDLVFTHWPVDRHRDHRICSLLVYDAWIQMQRSFDLYYFEVESGEQTQNFSPTDFVDITPVVEKKHEACFAHASQQIEEVYEKFHTHMEKFRGLQANCDYAEAFVKHHQSLLSIGK